VQEESVSSGVIIAISVVVVVVVLGACAVIFILCRRNKKFQAYCLRRKYKNTTIKPKQKTANNMDTEPDVERPSTPEDPP